MRCCAGRVGSADCKNFIRFYDDENPGLRFIIVTFTISKMDSPGYFSISFYTMNLFAETF